MYPLGSTVGSMCSSCIIPPWAAHAFLKSSVERDVSMPIAMYSVWISPVGLTFVSVNILSKLGGLSQILDIVNISEPLCSLSLLNSWCRRAKIFCLVWRVFPDGNVALDTDELGVAENHFQGLW